MTPTRTLAGKQVGPIGFGMMGMTWKMANPNLPPQDQCFTAMDAALASGANFFNGGELYGEPDAHSGHLLRAYLTARPDNADKIVLSIKGGTTPGGMHPDGSEQNARRSVEDSLASMGGTLKKIDIFEYARVDPKVPVEDTLGYLKKLVDEGKIGSVAISEVKASTIERAVKILPVSAVEVELSLWATEILRNGVVETCARLGVPIVAYSPLMRGALTDEFTEAKLKEGGFLSHLPKMQDDVRAQNMKINMELDAIAKRKGDGVTKSQLAINWVAQLSGRKMTVYDAAGNEKQVTMPTIIPIPGSTKAERVQANSRWVPLTDEEMDEIIAIVERNPVTGDRYPAALAHLAEA